jgi:hypothetical protein
MLSPFHFHSRKCYEEKTRMRTLKFVSFLAVVMLLLAACGGKTTPTEVPQLTEPPQPTKAAVLPPCDPALVQSPQQSLAQILAASRSTGALSLSIAPQSIGASVLSAAPRMSSVRAPAKQADSQVATLIFTQEPDTLSPLYTNMYFSNILAQAYNVWAWQYDDPTRCW